MNQESPINAISKGKYIQTIVRVCRGTAVYKDAHLTRFPYHQIVGLADPQATTVSGFHFPRARLANSAAHSDPICRIYIGKAVRP